MLLQLLFCTLVLSAPTPSLLPPQARYFPQLIVPISSSEPDKVFGTQYDGIIASSNQGNTHTNLLLEFNIPASANPATCSLTFTNITTVSNPSIIDSYLLTEPIDQTSASWNKRPKRAMFAVAYNISKDGNSVPTGSGIHFFQCNPGSNPIELQAAANESNFSWFQSDNPFSAVYLKIESRTK